MAMVFSPSPGKNSGFTKADDDLIQAKMQF